MRRAFASGGAWRHGAPDVRPRGSFNEVPVVIDAVESHAGIALARGALGSASLGRLLLGGASVLLGPEAALLLDHLHGLDAVLLHELDLALAAFLALSQFLGPCGKQRALLAKVLHLFVGGFGQTPAHLEATLLLALGALGSAFLVLGPLGLGGHLLLVLDGLADGLGLLALAFEDQVLDQLLAALGFELLA